MPPGSEPFGDGSRDAPVQDRAEPAHRGTDRITREGNGLQCARNTGETVVS